jgi:hypothetical protein
MSDPWVCFAAFVVGILFLSAGLLISIRANTRSGQAVSVEGARLMSAVRNARRPAQIAFCFVWAIFFLLRTGGLWTAMAALFTAVAAMVGAVCGVQWIEILQIVRGMLQDFYDHQRAKAAK